jgi:hypothetical protein
MAQAVSLPSEFEISGNARPTQYADRCSCRSTPPVAQRQQFMFLLSLSLQKLNQNVQGQVEKHNKHRRL